MPRKKACPRRLQWELENAEGAGGGKGTGEDKKKPEGEIVDRDDDENGDIGSDSEESVDNGQTGSRESSPASPPPVPKSKKNGSGSSAPILDFSTKTPASLTSPPPSMTSPLSRKGAGVPPPPRQSGLGDLSAPLDLSVSHKKPKSSQEIEEPIRKLPKWSPPIDNHRKEWNGHNSPDIKALEKMSEMRVGVTPPRSSSGSSSSWQANWLAQNSTGNREIFKCVVCRATFNTLAALSIHMKDSKHGPPMPNASSTSPKIPPPQSPVSSSNSNNDSLLLKETVQLPRKLVRGQDVWLGKGAEQTRQILKCMWCGQSFRSLAEMTQHMQQTQHYTNIISQEQLISWRSSEDKGTSANSHVSAVLTCKVCDQAFSSLKELSNHMVKNSHYKEHIMRSITESGSRRRQSREKRKKSLPVRKLLELERANQEMKKEIRITCEKCLEKIPGPLFVEHLRVCGNTSPLKHNTTPSPKLDSNSVSSSGRDSSSELDLSTGSSKDKGKDKKEKEKEDDKEHGSAINAIEKMIEKSFDYRSGRHHVNPQSGMGGPSPPIGTSILKRLGIDESVDYTKPLLDSSLLPLHPSKFSSSSSFQDRSRSQSVSSDKSESRRSSNASSPQHNIVHDENMKSPEGSRHSDATMSDTDNQSESNNQSSIKNNNNNNTKHKRQTNSLSALSSMFESIGGSGSGAGESNHSSSKNSSGSASAFNSHHPLAALQKLCDKTENTPGAGAGAGGGRECGNGGGSTGLNSRPTSTSSSNAHSSPEPNLLGLNWAAAAANAAAADASDGNVFKCTFCDTPFLSKGAYRLHLAKMHFVKESKSPQEVKEVAEREREPTINSTDSPASKLIKYAELAKQLSSK